MYGVLNELMSFQLLDNTVIASAMIAVAACGALTAKLAASYEFQLPSIYTGFSETIVKPEMRSAFAVGALLIAEPRTSFSARRKRSGRLIRTMLRDTSVVGRAAVVSGTCAPGTLALALPL